MEDLTEKELQVLEVVSEGLTDKAAGARLFITSHTIKHHMNNIYRKLDIKRDQHTNMRVTASRLFLERQHDQHTRAIRAHLENKHLNGDG